MIIISWIGSFLLAICGLPIAYEAYINKGSDISNWFLFLWGTGEVLTLSYVLYKKEKALTLNYFSNIMFIGVVCYYKFFY